MTATTRPAWTPLVIVAMAQALLVFNVAALKISIEGIVHSFDAGSDAVKTAIIAYSLVVAACIMVGARIASTLGARRVFRIALVMFGLSMAALALSTSAATLVVAQIGAGMAAAALTPASVMLLTQHYSGEPQEKALGWLSGARSLCLAPAFLIAGAIATLSEWRVTFTVMLLATAIVFVLSRRLSAAPRLSARARFTIAEAAGLAAFGAAMLLIGLGSDNLVQWGVLRAQPEAPFSPFNLSPAPLIIACGVALIKVVLDWTRRRRSDARIPLARVLSIPRHRSMLFSIFTISAISSGVTFLLPLYIEIVQGRSSLHTALALVPFTLSSFAGAVSTERLRRRCTARSLTRIGFVMVAAGLGILGLIVRNDWSNIWVVLTMALAGFGEGVLATLLLTALAAIVPQDLSDDVEPLCDATTHLATAVGAALVSTLIVGALSVTVNRQLSQTEDGGAALRTQINLERISFVSNDRLHQALARSRATPEQVEQAVRINTDARLFALKLSFLALAVLTLIGLPSAARGCEEGSRDSDWRAAQNR